MTAEISLSTISHCNPYYNCLKVFCLMRPMKKTVFSLKGVSNKKSSHWLLRMVRFYYHKKSAVAQIIDQKCHAFREKGKEMRTIKSFSTFILSVWLIHLPTILSYVTTISGYLTNLTRKYILLKSFSFRFLVFILFYSLYNECNNVFLYILT